MKLTGKDVLEAACIAMRGYKSVKWDLLSEDSQETYTAIAKQINASHIEPLQALVQDFADLIEDRDLAIEDFTDGWWEKKEASLSQAKELLKGEK